MEGSGNSEFKGEGAGVSGVLIPGFSSELETDLKIPGTTSFGF
jgi:hypothetical protein